MKYTYAELQRENLAWLVRQMILNDFKEQAEQILRRDYLGEKPLNRERINKKLISQAFDQYCRIRASH